MKPPSHQPETGPCGEVWGTRMAGGTEAKAGGGSWGCRVSSRGDQVKNRAKADWTQGVPESSGSCHCSPKALRTAGATPISRSHQRNTHTVTEEAKKEEMQRPGTLTEPQLSTAKCTHALISNITDPEDALQQNVAGGRLCRSISLFAQSEHN